jgi:hypothetical protein
MKRTTVAVIGIRNHGQRHRCDHGRQALGHSIDAHPTQIGTAQFGVGNARTGQIDGLESSALDEACRQAIGNAWRDQNGALG